MIWIRADANSEIGTGHIMRCLSIAAALRERGKEICFVTADEEAASLLTEKKQAYCVLYTDYRDMEGELNTLLALLVREKPELVVVDSYFVTESYLQALGGHTKTAYVDDKCLFSYPVDFLINYNIYGHASCYGENVFRPQRKHLMGPDYAPLREEFRGLDYKVRERAENVLITTGGSDKYNLAGQIAETLILGGTSLHLHVVSGRFNKNVTDLQALAGKHSNVHIHQNVTDMAELMYRCDIAVTAGGSTMYELCAAGVPIICFSFVDNQEQIVETFFRKGLVCYGGNYLKEKEALAENVAEHIRRLAQDREARDLYSQKERELVDGFGARRIATALCGGKREGIV